MPCTRLGLLVTDRGAWLFAPRAGKLDPRGEAGLSAVELMTHREAALALSERILGQRKQPFPALVFRLRIAAVSRFATLQGGPYRTSVALRIAAVSRSPAIGGSPIVTAGWACSGSRRRADWS